MQATCLRKQIMVETAPKEATQITPRSWAPYFKNSFLTDILSSQIKIKKYGQENQYYFCPKRPINDWSMPFTLQREVCQENNKINTPACLWGWESAVERELTFGKFKNKYSDRKSICPLKIWISPGACCTLRALNRLLGHSIMPYF